MEVRIGLHSNAPRLGLLLSSVTKRRIQKPNEARSFGPCFHRNVVKNARNGATITALFALLQQKQNTKSAHLFDFYMLAKSALFLVRRQRPRKFSLKIYRVHGGYT